MNRLGFLSYFCPRTSKFPNTWEIFDRELSFPQQVGTICVTAFAALASLPFLGLGGLAAFRLMVEKFKIKKIKLKPAPEPVSSAQSTAAKVSQVVQERTPLSTLEIEDLVKRALRYFADEVKNDDLLKETLRQLFQQYTFTDEQVLLRAIQKPQISERHHVLIAALELGKAFTTPIEFSSVIDVIKAIPLNKREGCIRIAQTITTGVTEAKSIKTVIEFLVRANESEHEELLTCAQKLAPHITEVKDRVQIMNTLIVIEKEHRANVVEVATPLLKGVTNVFLYPEILNVIAYIDEKERNDVIALCEPFILKVNDPHTLAAILKAVGNIPSSQRKELIEGITKYLEGINKSGEVLSILQEICNLPENERLDTVNCALPHARDEMTAEERGYTLRVLQDVGRGLRDNLSQEEVKDKVELMTLVSGIIRSITDTSVRKQFMDTIKSIPQSQRFNVLNTAAQALSTHMQPDKQMQIIYALFIIAPQYRTQVAQEIIKANIPEGVQWSDIVSWAFRKLPNQDELRDATYAHLNKMLEEVRDRQPAYELARGIWNNRAHLRLLEEHSLAQLALRIMIVSDPGSADDPLGPFNLYRKLIDTAKKPTPAIVIPSQTVGGVKISLVQATFEKHAQETKRITFSELPKNVGSNTISSLFEKFENRLKSLNSVLREKTDQYIANITGENNFNNLKNNFCSDPLINDLASARGAPDEAAPAAVYQLFAIMKFICDQPSTITHPCPLSPQEEVLLQMSNSIQNCSTGKRYGVAMAYNRLPLEYRQEKTSAEDPEVLKVQHYIDGIIQEHLAEVLSNESPMLFELTGASGAIAQLSHQNQYLKNFIGKRVGLKEDITFDHYTSTLYATLVNRSLENTLTLFYRHVKPSSFVEKLRVSLNRDIKEKKITYSLIDTYGLDSSLDRTTLWSWGSSADLDATDDDLQITEKAVIEILIKAKYFQRT